MFRLKIISHVGLNYKTVKGSIFYKCILYWKPHHLLGKIYIYLKYTEFPKCVISTSLNVKNINYNNMTQAIIENSWNDLYISHLDHKSIENVQALVWCLKAFKHKAVKTYFGIYRSEVIYYTKLSLILQSLKYVAKILTQAKKNRERD